MAIRRPQSSAIRISSWTAISKKVRRFKDAPARSLGVVVITFKRDGRTYTLNRRFPKIEWLSWMRASSPGRRWNFQYRNKVG